MNYECCPVIEACSLLAITFIGDHSAFIIVNS
jgi:hypothetical protein